MGTDGCYDKALELLAGRPHFRRQLEQKLETRGFGAAEIELCLDRLTEEGLLDDRRAAEGFVETRLRRGPIGRRRMRFELLQRGAPEDLVDDVLESSFHLDDLEATRSVAERWLKGSRRDPAALSRHLDRKGFTAASILRVVEEVRRRQERESEC